MSDVKQRALEMWAEAFDADGWSAKARDIRACNLAPDDERAVRALEKALSPEQGVRDAIERMKADLGDAIREEENPGKDEFAKAFNYGLRAARDLALRLIDGKWQTLALKQPGAA
jgi:hypothetical protein